MKDNGFADFVDSHPTLDAYSEQGEADKATFKWLGTQYLKALGREMHMLQDFAVSFNPGGIAGSGDFHFKGLFSEGKGFDMFFNLGGGCAWVTYRTTTGFTDYDGGPNRQMSLVNFHHPELIIRALEDLHAPMFTYTEQDKHDFDMACLIG